MQNYIKFRDFITDEDCAQSSECDVSKGLCCQLLRRHRQSPRKVSRVHARVGCGLYLLEGYRVQQHRIRLISNVNCCIDLTASRV